MLTRNAVCDDIETELPGNAVQRFRLSHSGNPYYEYIQVVTLEGKTDIFVYIYAYQYLQYGAV